MGQDQSRDRSLVVSSSSSSSSNRVSNDVTYNQPWTPKELDGYIILKKRADGSSVKELFIPSWRVSFYKANGSLELTDNYDANGGIYVRIDEASATLLYTAWHNYRMSKDAFFSASPVFFKYVDPVIKQ